MTWRPFRVCGVLLVFAVAAAGMQLWPALRQRYSDLEIAQRIERRIPLMRDRLSSAIDFLDQSAEDQTAGSYILRRSVIADAEARIEPLNLNRMLRIRPAVMVAVVAALLIGIIAGLLVSVPMTRLAARRLVTPWSNTPWPKRNRLVFVDAPMRMISGENLDLSVTDANGRSPENVEFQYRVVGSGRPQIKPMNKLEDRFVARLENVTQPIEYRATGGDDYSMRWQVIEVVEAPRVVEMQVTIHPPEYTGWPVHTSNEDVQALAGSHIEIAGAVNTPLRKMVLKVETAEETDSYPVDLAGDQKTFSFPADPADLWSIEAPGKYWLEMTDEHQLTGGSKDQWRIQPVPDNPPTVALEQPKSNIFVTTRAVLPLAANVKDDIEIAAVELRYSQSNKTDVGDQVVTIHTATPHASVENSAERNERGDSYAMAYEWDLATVNGLMPGQTLDFYIAASDFKPQMGVSPRRQLVVLDDAEFEDRIGQRQSYILNQLAEVLRLQVDARSQVRSLEIQLDEVATMQKEDIDALQSAELNQRQVQRMLGGENGVTSQLDAMLTELEISRIDSPDVGRRMSVLLSQLRQIEQQQLTAVQRELVNSLKIARATLSNAPADAEMPPSFAEVRPPLESAGQGQDQVIQSLQQLLDEYREWDNFRRFAREIRRIQRQQDEISRQTSQLPEELIGRRPDDLTPQEKANLKKLAQQQLDLSRQFDAVRSRMQQMQEELAEEDPLVSRTLGDAVEMALRRATSGQMREVGRNIESNRRGQAIQQQKDVQESLGELTDILANRREQELERLVEKLRESADELEGLREEQTAVREGIKAAESIPDQQERRRKLEQLTRQQQQLAEQADRLSRQLQRLRAERSAQSTGQAAAGMQQSGQSAEQGDSAAAEQQAELAQEKLKDAIQELQQAISQAEQELSQEKLAQLKQKIEGLAGRQQNVVDETARLEDLRRVAGSLSDAQTDSVTSLSREQRQLATETGILADKVADAEAFALGLRGAVREMLRTARGLDQLDTGGQTQNYAQIAKARLDQLVEALNTDQQPPNDENPSQSGQQPQDQPPQGDAVQLLAQLKLLKLMQQEINRRTAELEEARLRRGGMLDDEQQREVDELAIEQGQLADLLFNLSEPSNAGPEDTPDELPDEREPGRLDAELEKALEGIESDTQENEDGLPN